MSNVFELAAKLTLDSSEFKKGLDNAKNMASTIGNGFVTLGKVGVAAVGAATAAVGVLAKTSVDAGMDFDKSMSQVAATMGLSMEEMENTVGKTTVTLNGQVKEFDGNLRDFAQLMGQNTAFSATQAADALNYMALAGYDAQTSMNMLPNVLNLAAAGNMELARASDMVTDTQTAFGISLDRTSQMVDEMAKAASTGNTSVEQLGDAFLVVGGLTKELNGGMITLKNGTTSTVDGVQELEIALTAMANAGVKGSEAGTHMRNMILKLSSPTKEGAEQFAKLGVNVFDAEGKMRSLSDIFGDLDTSLGSLTQEEKIKAISDLFNTRDMAAAEALLGAVGQDWDAIGESILNADGAAEKMAATQLDNLAGDITLFKSALEGAQIAISDGLTPSLREFVQLGTKGLSEMTAAFKEGGVSGAMQKFGEILSEGLTMVTEKMPEMVNAGMQLLGALGQGLIENAPQLFSAMVESGEMILTAVDHIMRDAYFALLDFDWEGAGASIAKKIGELFDPSNHGLELTLPSKALGIIEALASGIGQAAPALIPAAIELLGRFGDFLVEEIPILMSAATDLIAGLAEGIGNPDNITTIMDTAINLVMALLEGLVTNAPTLIDAGMTMLTNVAEGLMNALPNLIEKVPEIIGKLLESVIANAPKLLEGGVQLIFVLINGIVQATPSIIQAFVELIPQLLGAFLRAVPQLITAGIGAVKNVIEGITQMIPNLVLLAPQLIAEFIQGMESNFSNLLNSGTEMVDEIKEGILGKISDAAQWGRDLVGNFVDGIRSKFSAVRDAVSHIGETIRSYIHFSEPDVGPLSDFHTYAPDMMKLFAQGIKDNTNIVANQMEKSFALPDMSNDISGSTNSVTGGNVTINVYGAEGQSEKLLAEEVADLLLHDFNMKQAVWGTA